MSSMLRFSSWKVKPPTLRTMLPISWLAASDKGCPSDQAGPSTLFSTPEEAVRVETQGRAAQVAEGVEGVADHQPHTGEGRVEPVQRRLALLEVVQVHPPVLRPVRTEDRCRRRPVGVLDAGLVEDHPLHRTDDVAGVGEPSLGVLIQVHRVPPGRNIGQEVPVRPGDLDHVVDARVVTDLHLGQPEVGALAGVPRDDVIDHRAAVPRGDRAHGPELVLGAELVVEASADPVEVTVDAGGGLPAGDPAGPLDRSGVDGGDADLLQRVPQVARPRGSPGTRTPAW